MESLDNMDRPVGDDPLTLLRQADPSKDIKLDFESLRLKINAQIGQDILESTVVTPASAETTDTKPEAVQGLRVVSDHEPLKDKSFGANSPLVGVGATPTSAQVIPVVFRSRRHYAPAFAAAAAVVAALALGYQLMPGNLPGQPAATTATEKRGVPLPPVVSVEGATAAGVLTAADLPEGVTFAAAPALANSRMATVGTALAWEVSSASKLDSGNARALARALGITGEPVTSGAYWVFSGAGGRLQVSQGADGTVIFENPSRLVPGCAATGNTPSGPQTASNTPSTTNPGGASGPGGSVTPPGNVTVLPSTPAGGGTAPGDPVIVTPTTPGAGDGGNVTITPTPKPSSTSPSSSPSPSVGSPTVTVPVDPTPSGTVTIVGGQDGQAPSVGFNQEAEVAGEVTETPVSLASTVNTASPVVTATTGAPATVPNQLSPTVSAPADITGVGAVVNQSQPATAGGTAGTVVTPAKPCTVNPCPNPVGPPPSRERAIAQVRQVFQAAGIMDGLPGATATVGANATVVRVPQTVQGTTSGQAWQVTVTGAGIAKLSGNWSQLVPLGKYEVISPLEAVERLNDPKFGPLSLSAATNSPSTGVAGRVPEPVAKGDTISLVSATLGAETVRAEGGSVMVVPAYQLSDTAGRTWTVFAVADKQLK